METIDLGIKFVRGWDPAPVPDPGTGSGALAQTGDFNVAIIAGLIMLALTIVGMLAYAFIKNRKLAGANSSISTVFQQLNFSNFSMRAKVVGVLMMILALTCILFGCFSTIAHAADGADSPLVPDKSEITAKVTEDGTFTLDTCKLTNEGPGKYTIEKSSVSIAQDATDIEGLDQTELTINGFGDGKIVFSGKPYDPIEFTPEGLEDLASGASTILTFTIDLPDDVDIETLLDKQVFTISLTPKQVATWIPMQAQIADGSMIDFYPAFNEGDTNVAKYKFAVKDGSTFNVITSVSSMSDIYNALQPASGTKTTTLYYQKTSSDAQALSCYTVKDLTWNFVFGQGTEGEATAYTNEFTVKYQRDVSLNDNSIKTALLKNDGFGSDWNQQEDIPKLKNGVKYIDKKGSVPSQNGGFYGCYGGYNGGLLSDNSYCPWGCCADSSSLASCLDVFGGSWGNFLRSVDGGVVLARAFN